MRAEINVTDERRFFTKVILSAYLLWITAFVSVGFYASTLPSHNLTTIIDQNIPFVPEFIWIYMACYIIPFLCIVIVIDFHRLNLMLLSFTIANLTAFIVYLVFPVTFQKPELGRSVTEHFLSIHYRMPTSASNNFPSMHVTFVWLYYFICRGQRLNKMGDAFMLVLVILITLSTLFAKMHLVADVAAGILLALITFALAKYLYLHLADSQTKAMVAFWKMARKMIMGVLIFGTFLLLIVRLRRQV
jgi:membrane-associated phospholipid phosphatase